MLFSRNWGYGIDKIESYIPAVNPGNYQDICVCAQC